MWKRVQAASPCIRPAPNSWPCPLVETALVSLRHRLEIRIRTAYPDIDTCPGIPRATTQRRNSITKKVRINHARITDSLMARTKDKMTTWSPIRLQLMMVIDLSFQPSTKAGGAIPLSEHGLQWLATNEVRHLQFIGFFLYNLSSNTPSHTHTLSLSLYGDSTE